MRKYLATASGALGLPASVALFLALLGGGLQVANQLIFNESPGIKGGIAVALVFLAGVGITPLVGPKFAAALRLPKWTLDLVAAGLSAGTLAVVEIPMSLTAHVIIATALTVASALGFAPNILPQPVTGPTTVPSGGATGGVQTTRRSGL